MKQKKYNYYTVDTGFLGAPVKLCFDKDAFQEALADHQIVTKETALGLGVAECHSFTEGRNGLIVMVFDYDDLVTDDDFSNIFATITHESVHCVQRIMDYIGEEEAGEEIHAYLTEHIVKQVLKGFTTERDKRNARKNTGSKAKEKSERERRAVTKVLIDNFGSSGSVSVDQLKELLRRNENPGGGGV